MGVFFEVVLLMIVDLFVCGIVIDFVVGVFCFMVGVVVSKVRERKL